jgi:Tol biopolymer transport system component/DNA-binding winged helix-turn-helix (wHTH) protein
VQNRQVYSFDNFELDVGNRQLRRDDTPVSLSAKAFDLLQTLVENNGRLVEKDELFNTVWRDQIVEESNLTVHISQIRKALGETKRSPRFIETVPGYGYRFVGEVSQANGDGLMFETETHSQTSETAFSSTAEATIIDRDRDLTDPTLQRPPRGTFTSKMFVAAIAFLLLAGGIYWFSLLGQNSGAIAPAVLAERQTQIKRLTSKGLVNYAVLSPDGKFFAYSLGERGNFRSSLWLGQTSGNSDVQLLPVADLTYNARSFSADGNWLYFTASSPRASNNGTLYKMPALGGVPQKLVQDINVYAVVSPDEKQVAFVRGGQENKTSALVIANTDGSNERVITVRPAGQPISSFSLSWSADGALVAFAAATGVGKSQEIFAANTADGAVKQITALEWIGISRLDWLKDGSGLVASARAKDGFAANQIWRIDRETGKAQKVTRDLQHYGSSVSLSADSTSLATIQAIRESSIWIAPATDLAGARQITFGSSGHEGWFGIDWTNEGKIIYTARTDQSLTIWTMDTLGANPTQLTSAGFLDERPSATTDGKHIVFQSNRSGATEIWRMNSDGTDLRQLTFDGRNSFPHTTPDGKTVVYTHESGGANSAWRVSIDGGQPEQIADAEIYNARVSPDGKSIAGGYTSDGKTRLAIVPLTGGAPTKLFDVPPTYNFDGSIRWTRDGRFISYRDWANGVWSQPVDGGPPVRLTGLPDEKLYHYEWAPDGRSLAFVRGKEVRDVVLIENALR